MPRPVSARRASWAVCQPSRAPADECRGQDLQRAGPCRPATPGAAGRSARSVRRTGLLHEVALHRLRRHVEDLSVVQGAAQLDVLGMRPHQRHGRPRAGRGTARSGMSCASQTCSGSRPLSLAKTPGRAAVLGLVLPAGRQLVVGALAGQQRPGAGRCPCRRRASRPRARRSRRRCSDASKGRAASPPSVPGRSPAPC